MLNLPVEKMTISQLLGRIGSQTWVGLKHLLYPGHGIGRAEDTLSTALETMGSGFLLLDHHNRIIHWNAFFEKMYPWLKGKLYHEMPFQEMLEYSVSVVWQNRSKAEQVAWVKQRMNVCTEEGIPHEQLLPTGQYIQITERRTPMGGVVIIYHDITELRHATSEASTLAFYDTLTGVPNRRLLLERLGKTSAIARQTGWVGVLLFLNLDKFKTINDTLGHNVGDALLQQVAQRLQSCVRIDDTVARLGADEFVILLPNLSQDKSQAAVFARKLGEKIIATLSQPYLVGTHTLRSVSSMGATLLGVEAWDANTLLQQADIAMYKAKAYRSNALCFFDPQMQEVIAERVKLENELRQALVNNEFVLHFQPQFMNNGSIVGAEVLLRWQHPERGLLSPGEFMEIAEDSALIIPIGQWVLRAACKQLVTWKNIQQIGGIPLAINVSAHQFHSPTFLQDVLAILSETQVPPDLITLELTESIMLKNVEECITVMRTLQSRGVHFALDDFGTGYSSMAYLTRLPLNEIKIDQSFVRNLGERTEDAIIVQTILAMARSLKLKVVAEGVETTAQMDILQHYGCMFFQGHYLAKACGEAEFVEQLAILH